MQVAFEESILLILIMMAVGQWLTERTRGVLSLQFVFGATCILLTALGILRPEIVKLSKLNEIGIIAFSILMINTGASLSIREMFQKKRIILEIIMLIGLSMLISSAGIIAGLFSIEEQIAHIALYGNGAVAAITSNVLHNSSSNIAFLPWIFFMIQSLIGSIFFRLSCRKVIQTPVDETKLKPANISQELKKMPMTYILALLFIGTLINKHLIAPFSPFHTSFSAIFVGLILLHINVLPSSPLDRTNTMEFLMMGLISLMAFSLSAVDPSLILGKSPLIILLSINSIMALILTAAILSRKSKDKFYRKLMMLSSVYIGFPYILISYKKATGKSNQPPILIGELNDYCRFGYYIIPVLITGVLSILIAV
jgi:hypothetical protein